MSLKNNIIFTLIFLVTSTESFAAPYKGVGGQIEAYGFVLGTFSFALKASSKCKKYPKLNKEASETNDKYFADNESVLSQLNKRIKELAENNGGDVELKRLKAEFSSANLDSMLNKEVENIMINEQACSEFLADIKRGNWDLKTRTNHKIEILME